MSIKHLLASAVLGVAALAIAPNAEARTNFPSVCLRDGSDSRLRMRVYPIEEGSPVVAYALHGEPVQVLRRSGTFSLILDSVGNVGWVPNRYLCG